MAVQALGQKGILDLVGLVPGGHGKLEAFPQAELGELLMGRILHQLVEVAKLDDVGPNGGGQAALKVLLGFIQGFAARGIVDIQGLGEPVLRPIPDDNHAQTIHDHLVTTIVSLNMNGLSIGLWAA